MIDDLGKPVRSECSERAAVVAIPEQAQNACWDTLLLAFSSDPGIRWLYPDPESYTNHFRHFAEAFGGAAFQHGTAHGTEHCRAVALWLPPGAHPDEEKLVAHIQNTVSPDRLEAAFAVFEQMGGFHPQEPYWHLPLIGTDPVLQGQGLGAKLLAHALTIIDHDHKPAYLEATSARSVSLYFRHGFEILGTIKVSSCPPITPMLRRPRRE